MGLQFGNILNSIEAVVDWIENAADKINGLWHEIDFTILYDWLPQDIAAVITAVVLVLLFLALIGVLKRILFFLG